MVLGINCTYIDNDAIPMINDFSSSAGIRSTDIVILVVSPGVTEDKKQKKGRAADQRIS